MQVRVKRSERGGARRKRRFDQTAEPLPERDETRPAAAAPGSDSPRHATPAHRARRRTGPPPEDKALYTCSCGLVFDAQVSTSVKCPHCGQTQAW